MSARHGRKPSGDGCRYEQFVGAPTPGRGKFGIRVKSGHKADDWISRARLVISPTIPRLARPAIFL
jgi:hypothetical protein